MIDDPFRHTRMTAFSLPREPMGPIDVVLCVPGECSERGWHASLRMHEYLEEEGIRSVQTYGTREGWLPVVVLVSQECATGFPSLLKEIGQTASWVGDMEVHVRPRAHLGPPFSAETMALLRLV